MHVTSTQCIIGNWSAEWPWTPLQIAKLCLMLTLISGHLWTSWPVDLSAGALARTDLPPIFCRWSQWTGLPPTPPSTDGLLDNVVGVSTAFKNSPSSVIILVYLSLYDTSVYLSHTKYRNYMYMYIIYTCLKIDCTLFCQSCIYTGTYIHTDTWWFIELHCRTQ